MERIIKTIPAEKGELYVTSGGKQRMLAQFDGAIEISERQAMIPILGTVQKGLKSIYASILICGDIDYSVNEPSELIDSGKVYDAIADVEGERTRLAGLRFKDSDPIKNTLVFEITDIELIQKLLT